MSTITELTKVLKNIKNVLYDEKKALINNDGKKVAEIIELKTSLIEDLKSFKGIDNLSENEKILELVGEIDSLQETNLLLTKQAISYQDMLMETIAKSVKNSSNTYSSKGGYNQNNNVSFIDQSI